MSTRGSNSRPIGPSFLRKWRVPSRSCTAVAGEIASAFLLPSIERSKSPQSARGQHPDNASFEAGHEAFLSGFHPLLVRSHASGHTPAPGGTSPLCFPDSSPRASLGPCSRMRGSALGSRAPRSGFANG